MEPTKSYFKKNYRTLRFLWSLSPSYLLLSLLSYLIKALLPYIPIYGSALIIDALIAKRGSDEIMPIVWWMIAAALFFAVLYAFLNNFLQARGEEIQTEVNRRMSKKTHELSYSQLEDNKTLRLMKAADEATNGEGGFSSYVASIGSLVQGVSNLVYSLLLLKGIFVVGTPNRVDGWSDFLNNPLSSLLLFGAVLLALLVSLPLTMLANKTAYQAMQDNVEGNRRFGYFYTLCNDYRRGKDIRLFSMQKMILDLQAHDKYGVNVTWGRYVKFNIMISWIITFLFSLLSFTAYGYLGLKALYGLISIGSAVAYAGAVTLLASGIETLIEGFVGMGLNSSYLQNYFIYLNISNATKYGTEKLDESQPLSLEFSHVSFTYPNQKEKALDDVSLLVRPGEKLAIVGVNGAGKTTLMKLVCRLYEVDSGEILINGKPLPSYDRASAERIEAIVFQDFKLFSFSIKDNVAGGENGDEDKIKESLQKADIYERICSFPDGINTILYNDNDKNGIEISGGEAQKIAIARALYKNSPLVILDEPTSALDPKSEAEIYEKFGTLVKGKTAVFISHRMSSTKFCDNIAVINKGKLVEYGNHEKLLKIKDGLYKQMWEAQAQYYQ